MDRPHARPRSAPDAQPMAAGPLEPRGAGLRLRGIRQHDAALGTHRLHQVGRQPLREQHRLRIPAARRTVALLDRIHAGTLQGDGAHPRQIPRRAHPVLRLGRRARGVRRAPVLRRGVDERQHRSALAYPHPVRHEPLLPRARHGFARLRDAQPPDGQLHAAQVPVRHRVRRTPRHGAAAQAHDRRGARRGPPRHRRLQGVPRHRHAGRPLPDRFALRRGRLLRTGLCLERQAPGRGVHLLPALPEPHRPAVPHPGTRSRHPVHRARNEYGGTPLLVRRRHVQRRTALPHGPQPQTLQDLRQRRFPAGGALTPRSPRNRMPRALQARGIRFSRRRAIRPPGPDTSRSAPAGTGRRRTASFDPFRPKPHPRNRTRRAEDRQPSPPERFRKSFPSPENTEKAESRKSTAPEKCGGG